MLVEDDAPLGNAVKLALHDASYAVDWVQDGESALRAIEGGPQL